MHNYATTVVSETGYVFTPDYYIRITKRMLSSMALTHAHSVLDDSVLLDAGDHAAMHRGLRAGYTEWVGQMGTAWLSLGWDWMAHHDGHLSAVRAVSPRTNILVLSPGGYDPTPQGCSQDLWAYIDALPWQQQVMQAI